VELLTQKISGIKKNLQQQQDALRDKENESSFAINSLTQERDQLSSKSKILDDTLQRYDSPNASLCTRRDRDAWLTRCVYVHRTQNLMKEREIAMTQIQQKLRDDLTKASSVLARKVLFDDSKNEVYNHFNVATFDRKRQQQQKEFVDIWLKHFHQFISHYGDYFSAFHERLLILNKSMTITDALRNINRKVQCSSLRFEDNLSRFMAHACCFRSSWSFPRTPNTWPPSTRPSLPWRLLTSRPNSLLWLIRS
jgi:hypothetical protein